MVQNESPSSEQLESMYYDASELLAEEEMDDARKILRQMLDVAPQSPWTIELCGDFAVHRGEYRKAEKEYRRMTEVSTDATTKARSALSLGFLCASQSRVEEACAFYDQAAEISDENDDVDFYVQSSARLADGYITIGQVERAVQVLQKALQRLLNRNELEIQDAESHAYEVASLNRTLGSSLRMLGQLTDAEECFNESLATFESLDLPIDVADTQDCLAVIRQIQGRYDEAEALLQSAIAINREHDNSDGLSVNYGNMAILCKHRKDYDQLEQYLKLGHEIDLENGNEESIADYHIQLGELHCHREQFAEAESNILKGLKMARELEDRFTEAVAYSNLGPLYRFQGELAKSEQFTLKALRMVEEIGNLDAVACVLDELATLQQAQGRLDEAEKTWHKSLSLFEQIGSQRMIEEVKQQLSTLR